jgi:hypothetical protein
MRRMDTTNIDLMIYSDKVFSDLAFANSPNAESFGKRATIFEEEPEQLISVRHGKGVKFECKTNAVHFYAPTLDEVFLDIISSHYRFIEEIVIKKGVLYIKFDDGDEAYITQYLYKKIIPFRPK